MKYKNLFQKLGLVLFSVSLTVLLAETALRFIYPAPLHYYVWPPHFRHTFKPDTTILSGINSISRFTINSYGVRVGGGNIQRETDIIRGRQGGHQASAGRYVLCLGGSTTECLYLDDNKTWEAQIANEAKAASGSSLLFIGSIGKSGCTSTENYLHLKYCVSQYKKINTVILMVGINDMLKRLSRDTLYQNNFSITPTIEDSLVNVNFGAQGSKNPIKHMALYRLAQSVYHGVDRHNQDDSAEIYTTWRRNRLNAPAYIDTLPDLQSGLAVFEKNLNLIIDEAEKLKLEVIFVNQAAFWRDSMSINEQAKLWMGGIGNFQETSGHNYYTTHALRKGLMLYNERLAKVCRDRKVSYIDIDSRLPHTEEVFYDDCHFNEAGAEMVGKSIYGELKVRF